MKHPHYDVMMEWAADTSKKVQFRTADHQPWDDVPSPHPAWNVNNQYRIKPEPKPDVVGYYTLEYLRRYAREERDIADALRLTFDGETGELKKAEVLK